MQSVSATRRNKILALLATDRRHPHWTILSLVSYTIPENTSCQKTGGHGWSLALILQTLKKGFHARSV
jgi:hypothetical protein